MLEVGMTLAGRYRVERLLGGGGMSTVVLAHDGELDRHVALKVFTGAANLEMAEREARVATRLRSEHVVRITDIAHSQDLGLHVVMEYLRGTGLAKVLETRGRLSTPEAVGHVLQATAALEEAHALDIIHLDIKPASLFLADRSDGSRTIKVLGGWTSRVEFAAETAARALPLTGSPAYMSPERLKSAHDVDGRADIWLVGVTLYELLTAKHPFLGETLREMFVNVLSRDAEPLRTRRSEIPEGLDAIVMRCLQRDPKARYDDVGQLARALAPFASEAVVP